MVQHTKQATLPKQQLAILALCRFAEPVSSTSVNPYVPEMIKSFNIPIEKVARNTGWLAACFSLSQGATAILWGRGSDRVGRKPMILLALTCVVTSSVLFGFSTSMTMAFVTRAMQGLSSGNVGIIRTAVAEMVPQKELQPRAFSIMPLVWNIGSIFGPTIGGSLVRPVEQYPDLFRNSKLFEKYPFALPNLAISLLFFVGILSGILFLRESHEDYKTRKDYGLILGRLMARPCTKRSESKWRRRDSESEDRPFLADTDTDNHSSPKIGNYQPKSQQSEWRSVFSYQSNVNLIAYTGLAMHSVAFDQILPVFLNYPTNSELSVPVHPPFKFSGGFGLQSPRIGLLLTIYGFFAMLVQFLVFPPVAKKYGVLKCFKGCALTFPIAYILVPFTSLIDDINLKQVVLMLLMLVKCVAVIFAFPCSTIMLTNSAVSLKILGTLNGVATTVSALGRAAGPALAGATFSAGVDAGYILVPFWVLAIVAMIAAVPVWWLVELEGFSAVSASDDEYDTDVEDDEADAARQVEPNDSAVVGTTEAATPSSPTTSRTNQSHRRRESYSLKKVTSPMAVRGGIQEEAEEVALA